MIVPNGLMEECYRLRLIVDLLWGSCFIVGQEPLLLNAL